MKHKTEQEEFWKGNFGNDYIKRNYDDKLLASNVSFFSKILSHTCRVNSIIEFGANIGLNLIAIHKLLPRANFSAVEINGSACKQLSKNSWISVSNQSVLEYKSKKKYDFVLTKGFLIHINPSELQNVYKTLYNTSSKYICAIEYYNPSPVGIDYRGFSNKLFKRDFAGEMLKKYPKLKLVDYGYVYHLDPKFPQDDLNWFLLEKE